MFGEEDSDWSGGMISSTLFQGQDWSAIEYSDEDDDNITLANVQKDLLKKKKTEDTIQCELCFEYFQKSYIWTHKANIHRVLREVVKRKNFKCKFCEDKFEIKSDLIHHLNEEHPETEMNCNVCGVLILRKENDDHRFLLHNIKKPNFICRQCDSIFHSRGSLKRHKFNTHCLPGAGRPLVPCNICLKTFLKTSLNRHKFEAHNIRDKDRLRKGKITQCDYCDETFERKYELIKHKCNCKGREEKKVRKQCDLCEEVLEDQTIGEHKEIKHGIKKPTRKKNNFTCVDCGLIFINKKMYISHRKVTHLGMLKEFQCKLCFDSFDTKESWDEHITEYGDHGGQYTCFICSKVFLSESGLRMHQNIHQKKFQCDICHMNLSSNASLITHKTKHSGLKPFQCDTCQKCFPYMSSLKYHLRTHENKKFVCHFCGQKFTFSFNFTRHIEQHHGKPDEKVICEHCGGLFAKHRIKDHLARHGAPTIPCDVCGKKFKLMNQVRKHKNQVHRKELLRYECPVCSKVFIRKEIMEAHYSKHKQEPASQTFTAIEIPATPISIYFTQ